MAFEDLKSEESTRRSFVRFVNRTGRRVDIVWINYDGVLVKYKTMAPISHVDVDTYVTHPWIFKDAETNQRLIVDYGLNNVFQPRPCTSVPPMRALVRVTIPMFTLKEHCIRAVRSTVKSKDDVMRLDIPGSLQVELINTTNWDL